MVELEEVIAPADVVLPNEDLRDSCAAFGALDHQLARLPAIVHRDLAIFDALGFEQLLRSPAIRAECLGINLDRHASPFTADN